MRLPPPPASYDTRDQSETRRLIAEADGQSYKRGQDVELTGKQRLIMSSPNGKRWAVSVTDGGALVVTAL